MLFLVRSGIKAIRKSLQLGIREQVFWLERGMWAGGRPALAQHKERKGFI